MIRIYKSESRETNNETTAKLNNQIRNPSLCSDSENFSSSGT